jgi:hypothetical protein
MANRKKILATLSPIQRKRPKIAKNGNDERRNTALNRVSYQLPDRPLQTWKGQQVRLYYRLGR